jgi:uncharacterized membrane protein
MNRKAYIDGITRTLTILCYEIELRNSINLTDLNIHAENFYRDLFNLVYGLGLGNMNVRRQNEAYIDLIDDNKKIAIQVTSDNTAEKISKTIEGFFRDGKNAGYRLKVLLIAKQAKDYRKDFTFNGKYQFDPEKDVVDVEKLLRDIADKDIDQLEGIANYLGKNIGNSFAGNGRPSGGILVGSERIDPAFIERIEKGEKFSRARFYTADQESYCQWYGVHNGYDISRDAYPALQAAILSSFGSYSRYKVAAIVHGSGGCGKSTLLRRLALEIAKEKGLKVFWVLNTQFDEFSERALQEVQSDPSSNYLIFVEDWYRIDPNNKPLAEKFIKASQEVSNIRIVVGDRDPEGKVCWDNLADKENAFELKPDENHRIVSDILEQHPEWKQAASEALANENSYNSALFLILFVLAGISEGRFEKSEVNFNDLKTTAQAIAKYDLNKIAATYPGLAKALFYWSCVYAAYHIFITYESFLKIADAFNENDKPSRYLANWNSDDTEIKRLRLYINVGVNLNLATRFKSLQLIQLNHDKLAEDIISKVSIPDWLPYNGTTKRILLDTLVDKGDSYSASIVTSLFLLNETKLFKDAFEEKSLIDKLFFEKKNRSFQYLSRLRKLKLNASDLYQYIDILIKEGLYPPILWLGYFEKANKQEKEKVVKWVLAPENLTVLPHDIIVAAFNQPGNTEAKEKAAKCVLDREDLTTFPPYIVVAAFNQPGNKEEKEKAAKNILDREDLTALPDYVVVAAFNQPGNAEVKEKAAKWILDREDLTSLPHDILVAAFNQPGNVEKKEKAVKWILDSENLTVLSHYIVVAAFNQPGNTKEKQKAVKWILAHEDLTTLPDYVVVAAFNQPGNREEKEKAAKRILDREDLTVLSHYIVVGAFNQPGNTKEKEKAAKRILDREDLTALPHDIIVAAFNQPGGTEEKEKAAKWILDREDLTALPPYIIVAAFNQPGNVDEKEKAAKWILDREDLTALPHDIIVAAFNQPGNAEEKEKAVKHILDREDLTALPHDIVIVALNQPGNAEVKEKAVNRILAHEDLTDLPPETVVAAFNQPGNAEEKEKAVKRILGHEDLTALQPDIVVAAFNQPGSTEEKEKAVKRILEDKNIGSFSGTVVVKAMKLVDNGTLNVQTAENYLRDWRAQNRDMVYRSLYSFSRVKDVPDLVTRIVEEIIRDYRDRSNQESLKYYWFNSILKIPFHQIPAWKRESSFAITAWKRLPRNMVFNLILSYRAYPDEIDEMCEDILYEWESEIKKPVRQLYGPDHFGDHIRLAMGHPELRSHATIASRKMLRKAENSPELIPDYLLEIAVKIIEKSEYPEWEKDV